MPKELIASLGIDTTLFNFPPCRPDLLYISLRDGTPVLQVIDVKASDALKSSHQIQVAMYALILDAIVKKEKIPLTVDLEEGFIWLYKQDSPEAYDLRVSLRIVEEFLRTALLDIFTPEPTDVFWHLYFRCEWCDFYEHCRAEAEESHSISLIPYMTTCGKRYLTEAAWAGGKPVRTLPELKAFLAEPNAGEILNDCGSLRNRRDQLNRIVQALDAGEVIPHGGSSVALPISENIRFFLTVQEDPVSGKLYALAFRRLFGSEIYGNGSREYILIAEHPVECDSLYKTFLRELFRELRQVHEYNDGKDWNQQKALQVYVFDQSDLTLFNKLLFTSLSDPEVGPVALDLLFHFQETVLSQTQDQPGKEVPYPIIVLSQVIRNLTAVPVHVSYRMPEVLSYLPSPTFSYTITPYPNFWFHLSNIIKTDSLFKLWKTHDSDEKKKIHDEIHRRLIATGTILDGIRHKVKDSLFTYPPKFEFPTSSDFHHAELSRLGFIVRYESFSGAMKTREERCRPFAERVENGSAVVLRYNYETDEGKHLFTVESPLDEVQFRKYHNSFTSLLTRPGEAGERDQMSFDDFHYRNKGFIPKSKPNLILARKVEITDTDPDGLITAIEMEITYLAGQESLEPGEPAVLHTRFTDYNSEKVFKKLREIDEFPESDYLTLIQNPSLFSSKLQIDAKVRKLAEGYIQSVDFMPSKITAFQTLLDRRMTLIWGPPGTGKTHFLAQSVIALLNAHYKLNIPFRVIITAFTHSATENLMWEINDLLKTNDLDDEVFIGKIGKLSSQSIGGFEVISSTGHASSTSTEKYLILGGTVYGIDSYAKNLGTFDMLLIDETSQMKIGDLSLAIGVLRKNGRMILAGDDMQLPPIIQGEYPEPEDGLPGLHESIFSYLHERDDTADPYTCQLLENFRMNTTLTRFPADTLYGSDFIPATPYIAERKIVLANGCDLYDPGNALGRGFLEYVIDPAFPMVLCMLDNVQATVENVVEADIVGQIACYLKSCLINDKSSEIYADSLKGHKQFWSQGLFIISPHHAQIRAILHSLNQKMVWHHQPFVGTVDKMQGQESQVVLASYGVSDIETALSEADFIYSLNRLNVTVTRGKSKCIIFLSRQLLDPTYELLKNKEAMKGLNHMLSLRDFCEEHGGSQVFGFEDGVEVTVYRGSV